MTVERKAWVISMEKKEKPKKYFKLRKRIRKTLGSLCLASAITIASIPVEGLQAVENLPGDVQKPPLLVFCFLQRSV